MGIMIWEYPLITTPLKMPEQLRREREEGRESGDTLARGDRRRVLWDPVVAHSAVAAQLRPSRGGPMPAHRVYAPQYTNSHALVIGVNTYEKVPPLGYARQDAEEFAAALVGNFAFPPENVALLTDSAAHRTAIHEWFFHFTAQTVIQPDDRLVVFFAGHGTTMSGHRGEVGFLVPVDGSLEDVSSLIPWDEFTKGAELIRAKHVLFVMDACYGGTALMRGLAPGATRFARDMLQRYARQVLTAGKADEQVADVGGPRAGHSVFTGHLLDALDGKASSGDGLISANTVMAYVYDRVARDYSARQTPHFGFLDGDGDLLFNPDVLGPQAGGDKKGSDVPIQVSPSLLAPADEQKGEQVTLVKELLAEPGPPIRLDDLVMSQVRRTLYELRPEVFPLDRPFTSEEFGQRLRTYEALTKELRAIVTLLAKWGEERHMPELSQIVSRLAEREVGLGGYQVWIGLQWYPSLVVSYAGGISALVTRNYRALAALLTTPVSAGRDRVQTAVITPVVRGMLDVERSNAFKTLPERERQYVPRSEYLLTALQPDLEDLLFLGPSYEAHFDRFEVFLALVFSDLHDGGWGPPGRFAYKHLHDELGRSPLGALMTEARRDGENWPPLKHGFFHGSLECFIEISEKYAELVVKFGWW